MIASNSPLVLALSSFADEDILQGPELTYSFGAGGTVIPDADVTGPRTTLDWSEEQKGYVRELYAYISTVVNLNFTEVDEANSPNTTFFQVTDFTDGTTGYMQPTGFQTNQLVIPTEFIGYADVTLIHEIGHSLGLSHPFDGPANLPGVQSDADLGDFNLNTELATRMSYTPGAALAHPGLDIMGEALSFGALDIAALQLLHGARDSTGLGDTTYGDIPYLDTIWDNGGHDLIDFSQASDPVVIDLRAASLEVDAGGGGYLSFISRDDGALAEGGYTIAFGVEIEDARGGQGDDNITGNDAINLLSGNGGNDRLDGGAGSDAALYSGTQQSYTLSLSAAGMTLEDRRGTDGTDTLVNIESLGFGDNTAGFFDLTVFAGTQNLSGEAMESFIELYIAYFNRAPDAVGLNFWGTAFANGTSLTQMATLFTDQDETRETYAADLSNADFVTAVYDNVLGRAGDQAGFDFWVSVLNDGGRTRDQFILSVLEGAKAAPAAGASDDFIIQQLADQQYLSIKTDIGAYYSVTKGMSDVAQAAAVMNLFDGSAASVETVQAAIDSFYASALDGETGQFLMPLVGVVDDPFGGALV
ncbi:MAG: DUF4214 domain-containing protein [Sulfitobacter sp.]